MQGMPLQSSIPEADLIECFPQSSGLLAVMMENDSLYSRLEVLTEAFPVVVTSFRDTDASAEHSRYLLWPHVQHSPLGFLLPTLWPWFLLNLCLFRVASSWTGKLQMTRNLLSLNCPTSHPTSQLRVHTLFLDGLHCQPVRLLLY